MKVLGIDQSLTGTALVVLEDGRIVYKELVDSGTRKGFSRVSFICDRVEDILEEHLPTLVQMEDYSGGANINSLIPLVELGGCIKMVLHRRHYLQGSDPVVESDRSLLVVSAQSMKKFVLGKGNVQKDTSYLLTVMDRIGQRFDNDNIADAYMHAYMASIVYAVLTGKTPVSNLTNSQQEALISKGVKKTKGMSIAKAMKLDDEEKRKLVSL